MESKAQHLYQERQGTNFGQTRREEPGFGDLKPDARIVPVPCTHLFRPRGSQPLPTGPVALISLLCWVEDCALEMLPGTGVSGALTRMRVLLSWASSAGTCPCGHRGPTNLPPSQSPAPTQNKGHQFCPPRTKPRT